MQEANWKNLVTRLNTLLQNTAGNESLDALKGVLHDESSADIALAMEELTTEQAICIFDALDDAIATEVLAKLEPERTNEILAHHPEKLTELIKSLPPREAASLLTDVPSKQLHTYLKGDIAHSSAMTDAQHRLHYPKGSVGRLMTTQFIWLDKEITVADALDVVRQTDPEVDIPDDLYVVDRITASEEAKHRLLGAISIRSLLMHDPATPINKVMAQNVISVAANIDETDAAAILSKYKFMTLPITDQDGYLIGVVPADDLMPVIVTRLRHLYTQAVGTDAETMEHLTPLQAAKLRVPWLLGTMVIELGAGLIISHFDQVLQKVILLASFMPVISAISGNVGLQAAAITVRALDSGPGNHKNIWVSLKKESITSLLMAIACGVVLGGIGAIWAKHLPFGIVIGVALTCSMLTAGLMGTVIPTFSKKLGFDPATTAGPFETAFQDIVGFAVFLGLATMLQHWMI